MPRSRTVKRTTRSRRRRQKNRLSEALQAFTARRLFDIVALLCIAAGSFTLLSLLTYHESDPSWNTAVETTGNIENWAGIGGAYIADFAIQAFGIAGLAAGLIIIVWGVRLLKRQPLRPVWLRGLALAAMIPLLSISAADWSGMVGKVLEGAHDQPGGTFGQLAAPPILDSGQSVLPFYNAALNSSVFAALALLAALYAAAISRQDIWAATRRSARYLAFASVYIASRATAFAEWVRHYNDPDYEPEPLGLTARLKSLANRYAPAPGSLAPGSIVNNAHNRKAPPVPADNASERPDAPPPYQPSPSKRSDIPVVTAAGQDAHAPQDNQARFQLNENGEWDLPDPTLLQLPPSDAQNPHLNEDVLQKNAQLLQTVLSDFNIEGEIVAIHPGPVVTLYELEPAPGIKTSRVISLDDDIARAMSAVSVRIAVVPGRSVIGIELPNAEREIVYMRDMITAGDYRATKAKLPLVLGKDIGGQPVIADLAKMPHLLVAGTTGSGKSVAVNTMILSLLYTLPPEKCRFIMIDPKMLELSAYDDIPNLLSPVVTEPGKAVVALKWTVKEMEDRYRAMSRLGVRNIEGYNARLREAARNGEVLTRKVQTGFDADTGKPVYEEQALDLSELPYIVVIVDEFADLMLVAGKDVEGAIQRLAQMARAAGIHLIMATQRPSVDVITGVVKANFPTRISFQVTSKVDSRTILGEGGAETLLGMGDMLYMAAGGQITRVHGPYVSDKDVEAVTASLRAQSAPNYISEVTDEDGASGGSEVMDALFGGGSGSSDVDELYDQAVALVAREGKASTSFVQRYLQIGYNRAARIIEEMERQGVISKASPTGKREVLVSDFSETG